MNAIDRTILEFCGGEFRPLRPLRGKIASGSLYRHAGRLIRLGWLQKEGSFYRASEAGLRQLAEAASGRQWDGVERLYPPLGLVPTPAHRAMIELILAAVVTRQHGPRPDRHPFFVCMGRTLHWKTSLGIFVCLALGLDPAIHVVDCGSESGKSLAFRRSGTGTLTFKRELLDAPFLVLDEFSTADRSVRATLGIFLSGRLVVPLENERLTVRPVPLLTLNPRDKATLEERTGLSAPQIRRGILADLDAVPMPDLATTGERALEAARARPPLVLPAPAADCQAFHQAIVELTRSLLFPAAHERVDVEVIVNLCTGMTAFLPAPAAAIAQVGHALGVLAETLGWARPGWVEPVTRFSLEPAGQLTRSSTEAPLPAGPVGRVDASAAPEREPASPATLSLQVPRPVGRQAHVPDLSLSDPLRARLIWFAVETGRPLDEALTRLLDFYLQWRRRKETLSTLEAILTLARELEVAQVEVKALQGYLRAEAALAQHNCTFEDVPEALRLIELLGELPEPWDWPQARAAMQAVAAFLRAGISADQVPPFLARHRRFRELGFDEETAAGVAEALTRAGATGERREAVLREMMAFTGSEVDRAAVEDEHEQLRGELATLEAERVRLRRTIKGLKTHLEHLARDEAAARQRKEAIDAECAARASDLAALRALRALLLRRTAAIDALWADLERLSRLRRFGRTPDDAYATLLTDQLRDKILDFLRQLVEEARSP